MDIQFNRRTFLSGLAASTALTAAGFSPFIRFALAMGKKNYPQGIHEIKGDVKINGKPAKKGDIVVPGDIVTTGDKSRAVFVIGKDAYLLRDNTQIQVESYKQETKEQAADLLRIVKGKVLSVFGKGNKRITTATAVLGIRGTGIYIEVEPERTYLCLCYGSLEASSRLSPDTKEELHSKHHESARYIYKTGKPEKVLTKAPMINHTDDELIMLEALTGRKPPFVKNQGVKKDDEHGGNSGGY